MSDEFIPVKVSVVSKRIVQRIISDFEDRAGFSEDWWDYISPEIRAVILNDLEDIVREELGTRNG